MEEIKKISPLEKENLLLRSKCMTLNNINQILQEKYNGLKNKNEIIKQIKLISACREEKQNNLYYYEDGQLAALKWCLGFREDTKLEDVLGAQNV